MFYTNCIIVQAYHSHPYFVGGHLVYKQRVQAISITESLTRGAKRRGLQ